MRILTLGIDPGTHKAGIAAVVFDPDPTVIWAETLVGDGDDLHARLRDIAGQLLQWVGAQFFPSVVAVEWQQIRPGDPRPDNIAQLNAASGMALGIVHARLGRNARILTPLPVQWKGTLPKSIHHPRVLERVPEFTQKIGPDAIDALGLALWAGDQEKLRLAISDARARSGF